MGVRLADMRHDVTPVEFVRFLRRLPIGPIMRELEEATEGTVLRLEPLDLLDGVLGRADDDGPGSDENVEWIAWRQVGETRGVDTLEIVEPFIEAEAGVFPRFLSAWRDVHGPDEAQPRRVHGAAMLGGDFLRRLPVDVERVEVVGLRRGNAEH